MQKFAIRSSDVWKIRFSHIYYVIIILTRSLIFLLAVVCLNLFHLVASHLRGGYDVVFLSWRGRRAIMRFSSRREKWRSFGARKRNEFALLMTVRLWSCRRTGCRQTYWSIDDSRDNLGNYYGLVYGPPDIFLACTKYHSIAIVNFAAALSGQSRASRSKVTFRRNATYGGCLYDWMIMLFVI